MDNKKWLLDHGYIPSDTLSELIDLVMKEQRQMCADSIQKKFMDSGPVTLSYQDYMKACINVTGEKE